MDRWFCTHNNRDRLGPFSSLELRQRVACGQLLPSHMVLREGSRTWIAANSIPGLFPDAAAPAQIPVAEHPRRTHPVATGRRKLVLAAIGLGICATLMVVGCFAVSVAFWVIPRRSGDQPKAGAETEAEKPSESVGLKPEIPIDEKEVVVPTKKKFNHSNVNETAEWVIGRTLETNQQSDNGLRRKNEWKALDEQMQALVGKEVEWRFKVRGISEESLALYQTWSTFDGARYPDDPDNRLFKPKSLIIMPRFRVEFYHEGKELFDSIRGPNGGDGMRGRKKEPGTESETSNLFRQRTSLSRQVWSDDALVISDEIGDKQAAALKPNDVVIVHAKVKAFQFGDSLLSTGFPSNCAVCTLEADRTAESTRERKEQMERLRRAKQKE